MIDALRSLDKRTAAGVLARAAISLDGPSNPAARAVLDNEADLRNKILSAVRERVGLSHNDNSPEALEKIGDILDQAADGLVGPSGMKAALLRLAEGGHLPPDMYELTFDQNMSNLMEARWPLEKMLAEATIRQPDREQHYGQSNSPRDPSLVSMFYRSFKTKWPFKDFSLLVVGYRTGLIFHVGQVWRIYPPLLDTTEATSLVDILRMFANKYGRRVEWAGQTGSFFLTVDKPLPDSVKLQMKAGHGRTKDKVEICQLLQHRGMKVAAALVVVIDLVLYLDAWDRMAVSSEDIISGLTFKTARDHAAS